MTMRAPDDGDPFNSGWNAALDEAILRVKALPTEEVAEDGIRALIGKPQVLAILRGDGEKTDGER